MLRPSFICVRTVATGVTGCEHSRAMLRTASRTASHTASRAATLVAAAVVGAAFTATSAAAQPSGCEEAAVRISTNALPRVGAPQWNDWVTLTGCGSRGATVIAGALRSDGLRTESELSRLDHLAGLLDGWFQPQLVNAYESLLRAPDASNAVRLRAMWLLSGLYVPNVDVAGPLQGYMSLRCETYERGTTLRDAPETLPGTAYDQASAAMAYVANDRGAPEYVRSTARCWDDVIRDALQNGTAPADDHEGATVVSQPTTVVVERPVRIVYECDNRFVFYNEVGYDLAVRYSGYGSGGVLRVAHGGPYVWAAARFGPVRFWVGDREVYYTDAVYRPCGRTRVIVASAVHPWQGWHAGLGVYIGVRLGSHRVIAPRVVYPRVVYPRVYRPVIVVPRGGRDDRYDRNGRNDRGRDVRNDRGRDNRWPDVRNIPGRIGVGRTDGGRNDGGGDDDRGRTIGVRNPGGQPPAGPRDDRGRQPGTQSGTQPGTPPTTRPTTPPAPRPSAPPRSGGLRPGPDGGPRAGGTPLPRLPDEQRARYAIPKGRG